MAFEAPALVLRALAEHAAHEPWAVALGAVALAVLGLKFFPSIVAPSRWRPPAPPMRRDGAARAERVGATAAHNRSRPCS